MDWNGRRIVITGASRGIGRSLALNLAGRGGRLVLAARSGADLEAVAREVRTRGGEAVAVPTDVAEEGSVRDMVRTAALALGGIDVLVNNAGVGLRAGVQDMNPADFTRALAVNLLGPLHCVQAVLPYLRQQGGGLVISISSLAGILPVPFLGGYSASKHAGIALFRCLRAELAGRGVRVMLVYPGSVDTDFRRNALGDGYPDRARASRVSPEQVAEVVARAAEAERQDVFIRRSDRLLVMVARLAPGLADRVLIGRYGKSPRS
ncbi:MAG: SDR family oxidoreductase [bacterium]|nr:SDR family oxidoreductase [bacterium]